MSEGPVLIPNWSPRGVLPPINSAQPTSTDRSPYRVSLIDFVLRFGNTEPRRRILEGFLDFRSALHEVGVDNGFQWINGSFVENIEMIEGRAPRDIDVVTFFHMPGGKNQETLSQAAPRLFDPPATKEDYRVDAYFVQLNTDMPEALVAQYAYWDRLWSHRRDGQRKGYVQIDLSPADDQEAKTKFDSMVNEGGQP